MAGVVISPLLQVVFENLASFILQKFGAVFGFKDSMKELLHKLPMIQAVIEDAEAQVTDKAVKVWLSRLKDIAQDAEDLLDRLASEIKFYEKINERRSTYSIRKLRSLLPLLPFSDTATELKEVLQVLDMTLEEGLKLHLRESSADRQHEDERKRETGSFMIKSEIYGREEDKERILELLSTKTRNTGDIPVIPIVGMGGIGKTTLAQLVYNDDKVTAYFDLKMWVFVSNEFNIIKIIRAIIHSATKSICDFFEMDTLQSQLRNSLHNKRFLLVLDDVWNEDQNEWDMLRILLNGGIEGNKIIATTRSKKVASMMGTTSAYHLHGLCEDDCWALFKQRAFGQGEEDEFPSLLPIGKQIVEKCGGVPLAVKTIGSLMRFKRKEREWMFVQQSELWSSPECQKRIFPALRLSYSHLPSELKRCFTFCSIFPKNYEIKRDKLIHLWMAEGLIISGGGDKQIEDIGEEYFSDLLWMCFFEEVKDSDSGSTTGYKMHNLIHDLATSVEGNDFLILSQELTPRDLIRTRHSSVVCDFMSSAGSKVLLEATHLRTLLLMLPGEISETTSNTFPRFRYLRVLDLHGSGIVELPVSVGSLACLRYLDVSNTLVRALPATICSLYSLQTLNLSGCCNLTALPVMVRNLISLRHLNITGCERLTRMPAFIGDLVHLQTLPIYIVNNQPGESMRELSQLKLRGKLKVKNLEKVRNVEEATRANMIRKDNIESLGLSWWDAGDNVQEHPEIKTGVSTIPPKEERILSQLGRWHDTSEILRREAEDILNSLQPHHNLKMLSVNGYPGMSFPQWVLPNLIAIVMTNCRRMESLPTFGQLPFLKTLFLYGMDGIKHIGAEFYGDCTLRPFPSLKELILQDFPNLEQWPDMDGTELFPVLSKLTLNQCPLLTSTPLFPSLKQLRLRECNKIILNCIMNLTSLSNLGIESIQDLLTIPGELLKNNSLLTLLKISSCHNLCSLPPEIENLTVLKALTVSWCEELTSLPEGLCNLKTLETLEISECRSLLSLPQGVGGLSSLGTLSIENCTNLTTLSTGVRHLTALMHLTIMYCPNLILLPEGLHRLSALRSLNILHCPKLLSLSEELQHVTTLQSLEIHGCPGMSSLPEWVENLSSLRSLSISDCQNIVALPEGLLRLTALQHLSIWDCHELEERCKQKSGEDWKMIAHIPHKHIGSTGLIQSNSSISSLG